MRKNRNNQYNSKKLENMRSQDKALQRGLVYSDKKVYLCKQLDLSEVKRCY